MFHSYYLIHHGIKGQQWGKRNGPPYPLDKKASDKIKKIYSKKAKKFNKEKEIKNVRESKERSGINKVSNDSYVIKKGSEMGRFSSSSKEMMKGSKYVYVTKEDETTYSEDAHEGLLSLASWEDIFKYKMSAIKDINVVSGKKVVEDVLQKYGNTNVREAYKLYNDVDGFKKEEFTNKNKSNIPEYSNAPYGSKQWAANEVQKAEGTVTRFFNSKIFKDKTVRNNIIKDYAKKGYDAMVDVEDWFGGIKEFPVILFDASKVAKIKAVKKV